MTVIHCMSPGRVFLKNELILDRGREGWSLGCQLKLFGLAKIVVIKRNWLPESDIFKDANLLYSTLLTNLFYIRPNMIIRKQIL